MVGPDVSLQRLILRAGLNSTAASRALWFGESRLVGNMLIAPDVDTAGLIERCFFRQLQAVMTDLEMRVEQFSEPKKAAPVSRLWKQGKAPKQGDML